MPNQIPVLNYIFNIIEDTIFWIGMSQEHIIIINELLNNQITTIDDEFYNQLNDLYDSYEKNEEGLENLKDYILSGEQQYQFYYYIGLNTQKLLQETSQFQIIHINLLSKLNEVDLTDFTSLLANHTMMEEKYVLELLSSNMNKIAALGFR